MPSFTTTAQQSPPPTPMPDQAGGNSPAQSPEPIPHGNTELWSKAERVLRSTTSPLPKTAPIRFILRPLIPMRKLTPTILFAKAPFRDQLARRTLVIQETPRSITRFVWMMVRPVLILPAPVGNTIPAGPGPKPPGAQHPLHKIPTPR